MSATSSPSLTRAFCAADCPLGACVRNHRTGRERHDGVVVEPPGPPGVAMIAAGRTRSRTWAISVSVLRGLMGAYTAPTDHTANRAATRSGPFSRRRRRHDPVPRRRSAAPRRGRRRCPRVRPGWSLPARPRRHRPGGPRHRPGRRRRRAVRPAHSCRGSRMLDPLRGTLAQPCRGDRDREPAAGRGRHEITSGSIAWKADIIPLNSWASAAGSPSTISPAAWPRANRSASSAIARSYSSVMDCSARRSAGQHHRARVAQVEPTEVGVPAEELDLVVDQGVQLVDGRPRSRRRHVHPFEVLVAAADEQLAEEVGLAGEEHVHRAHGEAGALGDLLQGRGLVALLAEHRLGGVEHLVPVEVPVLLAASRPRVDRGGHLRLRRCRVSRPTRSPSPGRSARPTCGTA